MHSKRCNFDVVLSYMTVVPDLTSSIVNIASPSSKGSQLYKGLSHGLKLIPRENMFVTVITGITRQSVFHWS